MLFRIALFASFLASSTISYSQNRSDQVSSQPPANSSRSANSVDAPSVDSPSAGPREIFFHAMRSARSYGAQELTYLLLQKSVREEIGLSEAGWKEIRDLHAENRSHGEKLYKQLQDNQITPSELRKELSRIALEGDQNVSQILEKHQVSERLISLFVQHRDASAALNKVVASKIGLDDAQRSKILEKREKVEREVFESASEEFQRSARNPDVRNRIWEKIQKKIDRSVFEELTSDQRSSLASLQGKPFTFEEIGRGPRPVPGKGREKDCKDCDLVDSPTSGRR
jgi:hypothetical protein